MPTVLITGANRGLGLEHVRQYLGRGWRVLATHRDAGCGAELQSLANRAGTDLLLRRLDVTVDASARDAAAAWESEAVDVLINNAGTYGPLGAPDGMAYQSLSQMDYGIWRQILEVNLLGSFRVAVAFRKHLLRNAGRRLVMVSSDLGSIEANRQGGSYAYRSSKAAMNMVTRGLAVEWPEVIVIAMAPGWSRTGLGGVHAPLEAAESVAMQQRVIDGLTASDSGRFLNRFGENVPW